MLFKKHKDESSISDEDLKKYTLSALNKKLDNNEFVKFSTVGFVKSERYYIFITNSKVHLVKRKNSKNYHIHSIGFEKIKGIDTNVGILYGMIILQLTDKKIALKNIKKDHTERFADILCDQISGYETTSYNIYKLQYNANVLETLEQLKASGIISDEDYASQKEDVLAS